MKWCRAVWVEPGLLARAAGGLSGHGPASGGERSPIASERARRASER